VAGVWPKYRTELTIWIEIRFTSKGQFCHSPHRRKSTRNLYPDRFSQSVKSCIHDHPTTHNFARGEVMQANSKRIIDAAIRQLPRALTTTNVTGNSSGRSVSFLTGRSKSFIPVQSSPKRDRSNFSPMILASASAILLSMTTYDQTTKAESLQTDDNYLLSSPAIDSPLLRALQNPSVQQLKTLDINHLLKCLDIAAAQSAPIEARIIAEDTLVASIQAIKELINEPRQYTTEDKKCIAFLQAVAQHQSQSLHPEIKFLASQTLKELGRPIEPLKSAETNLENIGVVKTPSSIIKDSLKDTLAKAELAMDIFLKEGPESEDELRLACYLTKTNQRLSSPAFQKHDFWSLNYKIGWGAITMVESVLNDKDTLEKLDPDDLKEVIECAIQGPINKMYQVTKEISGGRSFGCKETGIKHPANMLKAKCKEVLNNVKPNNS